MQDEIESLCDEAFDRFGASCLWSKKRVRAPGAEYARAIARALKSEGGRAAWEHAWRIEEACDAVDHDRA